MVKQFGQFASVAGAAIVRQSSRARINNIASPFNSIPPASRTLDTANEDYMVHFGNAVASLNGWSSHQVAEVFRSKLPYPENNSYQELSGRHFVAKLRRALTNRCCFETRDTWLGLYPDVTTSGEKIVSFRRCPHPLIPRPTDQKR